MAAPNRTTDDELVKLLEEIDDDSRLGDNAVVRRIRNRLHDYVEKRSKLAVEAVPRRRPCNDGVLPLSEIIDEFQADDCRRSVFVDPQEAVIAHLNDFHALLIGNTHRLP